MLSKNIYPRNVSQGSTSLDIDGILTEEIQKVNQISTDR